MRPASVNNGTNCCWEEFGTLQPSDQVNVYEVNDQPEAGLHWGIHSTRVVRRRKAVRYGSSDIAVEKCVKAVDRRIAAVLEQSAVSRQCERDAVVPSPLGDLAYVKPAATMIATKLRRSPWKVMSSNPARSTAGRKTARPQERKSGPPAAAVKTRACALGSTNSER
jgi:hypothetical protein